MIGFLKSWCEGILVAVMISVLIEAILPEGNNQKYVKVVIGIYLIFTILNPFLGKLKTNFDLPKQMGLPSIETSAEADFETIQEWYKNGMKEMLKNSVEEEFGCHVENLEIRYDETYENIEQICLTVQESGIAQIQKVQIGNDLEPEKNPENYEMIQNYLAEQYDIPKSKILINERSQNNGKTEENVERQK